LYVKTLKKKILRARSKKKEQRPRDPPITAKTSRPSASWKKGRGENRRGLRA